MFTQGRDNDVELSGTESQSKSHLLGSTSMPFTSQSTKQPCIQHTCASLAIRKGDCPFAGGKLGF